MKRRSNFLHRLFTLVLILSGVFILSRLMIHALPGNPLDTLLSESGTTLDREALRQDLGLDRPFWSSLRLDFVHAMKGDLGISILTREPVGPLLGHRIFATAELTFVSLLIALTLGLFLSLLASQENLRISGPITRFLRLYSAFSSSVPAPWIGPILGYLLAVKLALLPLEGSLILPAITLAFPLSGFWARIIHERLRETKFLESVRAARGRGLSEWRILLKYRLAPSLPALVSFLGTQTGGLLAGAFITEVIFDWPGLGSLLVDAVLKRDYPIVQGGVFVAAAFSIFGNYLGDLLQTFADPRERSELS